MSAARSAGKADIRVGTSGWSYPSGKGTWNGIFYPAQPSRRPRGTPKFDELAFYAEHFNTVEVNSSFYRVPAVTAVKKWAERTPADFEFSLKLYQKFTHPDMFAKATGGDPSRLGRKDVDEFRAAIAPLAEADKLGALLAQFPASFKNEPESRAYLEWLLKSFREYPVAVELRHRSWSEQPAETARAAVGIRGGAGADRRAEIQDVDPAGPAAQRQELLLPAAPRPQRRAVVEARLVRGSLQLPVQRRGARSRLRKRREAASREVRKAYLYANNHFSAKSVANAAILKTQLGQKLEGEYPAEFVEEYPDLKGLVKLLPEQPLLTPSRKPS